MNNEKFILVSLILLFLNKCHIELQEVTYVFEFKKSSKNKHFFN